MIRIERDPAFLVRESRLTPSVTARAAWVAARQRWAALASAGSDMLPHGERATGGFLFGRLGRPLGFACELHTLFTPEGWGREALVAGVPRPRGGLGARLPDDRDLRSGSKPPEPPAAHLRLHPRRRVAAHRPRRTADVDPHSIGLERQPGKEPQMPALIPALIVGAAGVAAAAVSSSAASHASDAADRGRGPR